MDRKEAIRSAYRMTGGNDFYDGMITCTTLSGKAVCRLVWDMNKAECDNYLEKALSGILKDEGNQREIIMSAPLSAAIRAATLRSSFSLKLPLSRSWRSRRMMP